MILHDEMTGGSALTIHIPGEPFGLQRHRTRVVRKGSKAIPIHHDTKDNRTRKAEVQWFMRETLADRAALPFADGPVRLIVVATFSCPRSQHRKRTPQPRRPHTKKPDADNVLKWIKDSATGVLWSDDKQVCEATVSKWIGAQGEPPGTIVMVGRPDDVARSLASREE